MREHKTVRKVLGTVQNLYYRSDQRRVRFVSLCHDAHVQRLTFEAYMHERLVRGGPMAHLKIMAHLLRIVAEVSR